MQIESVRDLVLAQNEGKKLWRETNTIQRIEQYTRDEIKEFRQVIEGEDAIDRWELASEIGDIEYLSIKLEEMATQAGIDVPEDIIKFRALAWQTATSHNIDMARAVHMKVIRNDLKYPASFFNDGLDYEAARELSRRMWNEMGGDKAFYVWYERIFGEI